MGWLPDPLVAKRYAVNPRTLPRWDANPELKFPSATYINGRKYRNIDELEEWDRWRAAGGGGQATKKPPRVAAAQRTRPKPTRAKSATV